MTHHILISYSSHWEWGQVMPGITSFSSLPQWYADPGTDPAFDDSWAWSYGGWTSPSIKQYNFSVRNHHFGLHILFADGISFRDRAWVVVSIWTTIQANLVSEPFLLIHKNYQKYIQVHIKRVKRVLCGEGKRNCSQGPWMVQYCIER